MPSALRELAGSVTAGATFGAALTASRVYLPGVIIDQMRFTDFHMLEVFLTAAATSALIIHGLDKLRIAKKSVRSNSTLNWFSAHDGNIIGGALLGVGMGLTGACPGTVVPQLALGISSSIPTTAGSVLGGLAYARYGQQLARVPQGTKPKPEADSHSIPSKLKLSTETVLVAFEVIMLAIVALSSAGLPGKGEVSISTVSGGLLMGLAQAVSLLLTSSPLGISGAYEQVGRYIWNALGVKSVSLPQGLPRPILFALGTLAGSYALGQYFPPGPSANIVRVSTVQGLVGGFLLTFGARIAGGCTSGHGLSGLSAFSYPSLLTTAAMFAGGALVQLL